MTNDQLIASRDPSKALLGITPGGKELYYVRKPESTVRFIAFGDGGELPAELAGGYTSQTKAQEIVDRYLAKKAASVKSKK